ncbi:hypothetical protein [[Eubacterium] cellulosolvens]
MIREYDDPRHPPGMEWKTTYSIVTGLAWLIFLIIWLFFYSEDYTINQNIGIVILSLFVMVIILGIPWMIWGLKYRSEKEKEMWRTEGFAWRVYLSVVVVIVFMIFIILWFFYYADKYNICQNLAILLVIIVFVAALMGTSWAPWGIRYGHKFDDKHWEKKKREHEIEREIERRVEQRVKEEMEKIKNK